MKQLPVQSHIRWVQKYKNNPFFRYYIAIVCTLAMILVSIAFLDKPITFFSAHHHFSDYYFLKWFAEIPRGLDTMGALLYIPALFLFFRSGRTPSMRLTLFFANALTIPLAVTHSVLKFIFGRAWPSTWIQNNPSLLHNKVYGFFWFQSGWQYASFPSGHAVLTASFLTACCLAKPKLRLLAALIFALTTVGLLGMHYHFLGDIIAGSLVGWLSTYACWRFSGCPTSDKTELLSTNTH